MDTLDRENILLPLDWQGFHRVGLPSMSSSFQGSSQHTRVTLSGNKMGAGMVVPDIFLLSATEILIADCYNSVDATL